MKLIQVLLAISLGIISNAQAFSVRTLLEQNKIPAVKNKTLDLSGQNITSLDGLGSIPHRAAIQTLILRDNKITTVPAHAFSGFNNLTNLDLTRNLISSVENEAFADLPNLKWLWLGENKIRRVQDNSFSGLPKLILVSVWENPLITNEKRHIKKQVPGVIVFDLPVSKNNLKKAGLAAAAIGTTLLAFWGVRKYQEASQPSSSSGLRESSAPAEQMEQRPAMDSDKFKKLLDEHLSSVKEQAKTRTADGLKDLNDRFYQELVEINMNFALTSEQQRARANILKQSRAIEQKQRETEAALTVQTQEMLQEQARQLEVKAASKRAAAEALEAQHREDEESRRKEEERQAIIKARAEAQAQADAEEQAYAQARAKNEAEANELLASYKQQGVTKDQLKSKVYQLLDAEREAEGKVLEANRKMRTFRMQQIGQDDTTRAELEEQRLAAENVYKSLKQEYENAKLESRKLFWVYENLPN